MQHSIYSPQRIINFLAVQANIYISIISYFLLILAILSPLCVIRRTMNKILGHYWKYIAQLQSFFGNHELGCPGVHHSSQTSQLHDDF